MERLTDDQVVQLWLYYTRLHSPNVTLPYEDCCRKTLERRGLTELAMLNLVSRILNAELVKSTMPKNLAGIRVV